MSKASEAGGDLRSSENLATAFLMLGITESSASALLTFKIAEVESTNIPEDEYETATYEATLKSPQDEKWKEAMQQEWQALIENQTFDIVEENRKDHHFHCDRDAEFTVLSPQSQVRSAKSAGPSPQHRVRSAEFMEEPIGCKWIYRRKFNPDGTTRYKARLVIKGYGQKAGIDYDETCAPVSKLATFRLLLALAAEHGWYVHQMEVVTDFLNPKIDRDNICMSLPPGIEWLETTSTIKAELMSFAKLFTD